ncbi:MAG: 6-bladed beta-propeller [Balneolaceae bacterium]
MQDKQDLFIIEEHIVDDIDVFLSVEANRFIGLPTGVKVYKDELYVIDSGFHIITRIDHEGNKLFSIGNHGRGPGEFDAVSGFWVFDESFLVYDYNGFKFIVYDREGKLVEENIIEANPVNPDGFPPNIPLTVHAISHYQLLIPSRGKNGSLFSIVNLKTDEQIFAGKAIGEYVQSYDHDSEIESLSRGEIPAMALNFVILTSSSSGIFLFQQTTRKLEKYSLSGEILWEKEINIPAQDDLFDEVARKNKAIGLKNERRHMFVYARAIEAYEEGVAVLLNMPEGFPVTVAWGSSDGNETSLISFKGLEQEEFAFPGSFSISHKNKRIYFLNNQEGIIYKAEWPNSII